MSGMHQCSAGEGSFVELSETAAIVAAASCVDGGGCICVDGVFAFVTLSAVLLLLDDVDDNWLDDVFEIFAAAAATDPDDDGVVVDDG